MSSLLAEVQGDYGDLDEALRRSRELLVGIVEEETAALLAAYERERGQDDLSSVGPSATLEALARGQVETVLLDPSRTVGQTAWFGPEPAQVASGPEDLDRAAVVNPTEAPLDDVLIRAAAATAATVRIVPPGAAQLAPSGVGGLLRYRL